MRISQAAAGVVASTILASCAGNPRAVPVEPEGARLHVVRLEPRIGRDIDASTNLSATVWYHVPEREFESKRHWVRLVFRSARGYTFSEGSDGSIELTRPTDTLEFTYSLADVLGDARLATPLTAYFYLLRENSDTATTLSPDTVMEGRPLRLRRPSRVIARSDPIFYGGNEPADSAWTTLRLLAGAIDEYLTHPPHKALAVVRDSSGRVSWGYGFGYADTDRAIDRAVRECEDRRRARRYANPCEVFAVDSRLAAAASRAAERVVHAAGTPEAVAAEYLAAVEGERWLEAAGLLDPVSVEQFHRQQVGRLTAMRPGRRLSFEEMVEQLMEHDPEMPRAVAEYQARRANEAMGEPRDLSNQFAGVLRADDALRLSPVDLAARHLEARDPRYRRRQAIEEMRRRYPERAEAAERQTPAVSLQHTVIGSVTERDELTQVLYRLEQVSEGGRGNSSVVLLPMRWTGDGWRVASLSGGDGTFR
jgi:hypothetical protein